MTAQASGSFQDRSSPVRGPASWLASSNDRILQYLFAVPGTQVEEELILLRKVKAKTLGRAAEGLQLEAWDRLYYMRIAQV